MLSRDTTQFSTYLVQSYAWETRVLMLSVSTEGDDSEPVSEMGECELPGFLHSLPTLYCGNMNGELLVQVTSSGIRLIDSSAACLLHEYPCSPLLQSSPSSKIFLATGNNYQIVVALSGGEIILLELVETTKELMIRNRVTFDQDIACLCLNTSRPNISDEISDSIHREKSDFLVVGLWTDHSVRILTIPSLDEISTIILGGESTAQARNVLFAPLSSAIPSEDGEEVKESGKFSSQNMHLFVGLGDGNLLSYLVTFPPSSLPVISNKQEVRLGTHPISLTPFVNKGTLCVFAGGDQPTILFSRTTNDQLLFSTVNISSQDITCVTPFHHPLFLDCLALASDSVLIIGSFDSLQRVHVKSQPLGEAPKHIAHHSLTKTLAGKVYLQFTFTRHSLY
jgi:DNA damage-binding protein 1